MGMEGNENSHISHFQLEEDKQLLRELRRAVTRSTVIAHQLKEHCVFDFKNLSDPEDDQQQGRNEVAEYVNLNGNGSGREWE